MAVINGSGISRGHLGRLMTPLILLLFMAEAVLSVVGKPWGVRESENIWQQQALSSAFDLIRPREFISSGDYHLYVGSLSEDNKQLQDVVLIQTHDAADTEVIKESEQHHLQKPTTAPLAIKAAKDTIILAKRAQQVDTDPSSGITQLDLYQGRRYEIGADSLKYNQIGFERYRISLMEPTQEQMTEENIETQKISTLWQVLNNPAANATGTATQAAKAELGYRFALPWLMIIAPMLAIPLAQVRPRQGRWLRLFPAILLFVSCALTIISLKNAVAKGSVSVWAYVWVVLGFMALALYLNWASRLHHRVKLMTPPTTDVTEGL